MGTSTSWRMSGKVPGFHRKDQQEINNFKWNWNSARDFPGVSFTVISFTPTGDPAAGLAEDGAVSCSQADGGDVVCEKHGGRQPQQADVVVEGRRVVPRVAGHLGNVPRHFIGVRPHLAGTTQENRDAGGVANGNQNKIALCLFYSSFMLMMFFLRAFFVIYTVFFGL